MLGVGRTRVDPVVIRQAKWTGTSGGDPQILLTPQSAVAVDIPILGEIGFTGGGGSIQVRQRLVIMGWWPVRLTGRGFSR